MDGLGDIEDLFKDSNVNIASEIFRPVKLHKKREKKFTKALDDESKNCKTLGNYFQETGQIPGTQSIFIKTWGCTHNTSDSEFMAGLLASYGYHIIDDRSKADLWILNSCTVKNPAEDHLRNEIESAKSEGKYIVVAGCVSQAAPNSSYLHKTSLVGVQQIDRIVEVVEETLKGSSVRLLGNKKLNGIKQGGASLTLPKIRRNPLIEIIPISTGCLNHCTYCKTKHARGELGSYPIDAIVERAIQAFQEGVCELWITSEDTGAYGRDIGTNLPELLRRLVEEIPEGSMMRLGMTNPPYILDHMEAMAEILNHPKVYSFLHIPVQSGSDCVLGDMKREYTQGDFCCLVDHLRKHVPNINIVTDIICGFPTETEKDFQDSLDLCDKYKFASLYINQFYPRPGTPAANMPRINTAEVKRRTKQLTNLFQSYQPYDGRDGREYEVLITEVAHDNTHLVGHNKFYEQILIPLDRSHLGTRTRVKIVSHGRHFMVGEVVRDIERASVSAPLPLGKVSGLSSFLTLQGYKMSDNKSHWFSLSLAILIGALLVRWICFVWQNKM